MTMSDVDIRRVNLIAEIYRRLDKAGCHVAAGLDLDTLIHEYVEALVDEEREACAKAAEAWPHEGSRYIAAVIRARGQA